MKKNHSVNIGGQLFNIDEDALRRLEEYFTRLRGYFGGNGDAAEMLADVEARIAELLIPLSRGSERVVDMASIEAVIGQMGQPEEWGTPDEEGATDGSSARPRSHRRSLPNELLEPFLPGDDARAEIHQSAFHLGLHDAPAQERDLAPR